MTPDHSLDTSGQRVSERTYRPTKVRRLKEALQMVWLSMIIDMIIYACGRCWMTVCNIRADRCHTRVGLLPAP